MIRTHPATLTGRKVLAIVAGFFAAILAVNGTMAWLAIDTFPGLVSRNAYREGLDWNRTIEAKRAQAAMGWQVNVGVGGGTAARTVTARFRSRDGQALTGLAVTAALVRPVVAGIDRTVRLEEIASGEYAAAVDLAEKGNWLLRIEARRDDGTVWNMERALWLE